MISAFPERSDRERSDRERSDLQRGDRLTLRKLAVLLLLAFMLGLAPVQSTAALYEARTPVVYVLPRQNARRYRRTALRRLGLAC